jgi:hypothetical protein
VFLKGEQISASCNLRALARYGQRHPIVRVTYIPIAGDIPGDWNARLRTDYANGAYGVAYFASKDGARRHGERMAKLRRIPFIFA